MRAICKAKMSGLKPIRTLPTPKGAQKAIATVKGKRVTPKALPAKAVPAKLSSAYARQTWGSAAKPVVAQSPKQPTKHLATTSAATSSTPKTGSVKIPVVNDGKLNIMWSNASLSPTNVFARITALKKWLKANLSTCPKNESGFHDCILDVSHNKMGEKAVGELLDVLQVSRVAVRILKMYHMDLTDGVATHIAKLIKANGIRGTPVRELHLSHNKLGRQGVQLIIAAAGNSGAYPYSRISGSRKMVSLWLRLEHNPVPRVDNVFDWAKTKGWSICSDSPCRHQPTCMIAVPSFSSGSSSIPVRSVTPVRPVPATTSTSYTLSPIPGRGKGKGEGGAGTVFPGKGKSKGAVVRPAFSSPLAQRQQPGSQSATDSYQAGYQSGTESTKGGKGAGKGKKGRKGGRPGAPPDPETKKRGKEVYRLLWDMAQTKTLVQSWLPDWGRASPYQRMEWFGDKILGHLLTERVWSNLDHTSESFLTQFHQQATCNKTLAHIFDMCDVSKIMEAMNPTPKSREPLRAFKQGTEKDVIKRRGDAIEVIFGDLSQQAQKLVDTSEAPKISNCLQLLTDLCMRCAEYFFEMPYSGRKNTTATVVSSSAPSSTTKVTPKNHMKAPSKASAVSNTVPKSGPGAVCKMGTPHSKASSKCRPSGMTIAIAVSPERYQQGDTMRPQVGERVVMGVLKYTECVMLNIPGWLHLPAVDPMIKKFDEWAPEMDLDCDFVLGRRELSLLALTPFALNISWTMRIDHRNKQTLLQARTMTDTTSKDAKATAMRVSKIDVTSTQEFPTCGVMVSLGSAKFFVVLDGCDFRNQDGEEMDLAVGPENDETLRQWWTKTLFVPQVLGVITSGPKDEGPVEVERVEVFPQEELAKGLDRKVSYGFMHDVFSAIRTILGNKTTASAIVDYVRDSGEVKVFEIAAVKPKPKPFTLDNHLHAKAVAPAPPSPSVAVDDLEGEGEFEDFEEDEQEVDVDVSSDVGDIEEELEFDGAAFEESSSFLKKLQALTAELEFDDDTEAPVTEDFSSWEKTGATDVSASEAEGLTDTEFDVEFDDDGSSMLAEGELDFDGDYESSYDGDTGEDMVFEQDDLDIDVVDFPDAAEDAGSDAEDILIEGDQADDVVLDGMPTLIEGDVDDGEEDGVVFEEEELDIDEVEDLVDGDVEENVIDYAAVAFVGTHGEGNEMHRAAPVVVAAARTQVERVRGARRAEAVRTSALEEEKQRHRRQQLESEARARQEEKRVQMQQMEDDARLHALLEAEARRDALRRPAGTVGGVRTPQHAQQQDQAQRRVAAARLQQMEDDERLNALLKAEARRDAERQAVRAGSGARAPQHTQQQGQAQRRVAAARLQQMEDDERLNALLKAEARRDSERHAVRAGGGVRAPQHALKQDDHAPRRTAVTRLQQAEDDARLHALLEDEGGRAAVLPSQHAPKQEGQAQRRAMMAQLQGDVERKRRQVQMSMEARERALVQQERARKDSGKTATHFEVDYSLTPSRGSAETVSPQDVYVQEAKTSEQKRRKLTHQNIQHHQALQKQQDALPVDDAEADIAELELDGASSEDYVEENKSDIAMEAEMAQEESLSGLIDATHLAAQMLAADLAQHDEPSVAADGAHEDDDDDLAFD